MEGVLRLLAAVRGKPLDVGCALVLFAALQSPLAWAAANDATVISATDRLTHYDLTLFGEDREVYFAEGPAAEGARPDRLEATNASVDQDGVVRAEQGTLFITSLFEDAVLTAAAGQIEFDPGAGTAELRDSVVIQFADGELALTCDYFFYDSLMERMEVAGARVSIPLAMLIGEERLRDRGPRAQFGNHFYTPVPRRLQLTAGRALLDLDERHRQYVLRDVLLSHHPDPDPDLFLHVDELRLDQLGRVELRGLSLQASGIELIAWPSISRDLRRKRRMVSLGFPILRFEREVGVAWKQSVEIDLDVARIDALLDYSPEYGVLTDAFLYVEPWPGGKLGIEAGARSVFDINRVSVERRTDYNVVYRQYIKGDNQWLRDVALTAEYGEIVAFTRAEPAEGILADRQEDIRLLLDGLAEFPLLDLGGGFYITTGLVGRYVEYDDAAESYRVAGAQGGLLWRRGGFDHFILFKEHRIGGSPLFSFDEVREREIDLMTSVRLHPDWRHVVRAIYDAEEEEFDQLQVSALKRMRTYEVGMYWDFARESAGLEVGLLVD